MPGAWCQEMTDTEQPPLDVNAAAHVEACWQHAVHLTAHADRLWHLLIALHKVSEQCAFFLGCGDHRIQVCRGSFDRNDCLRQFSNKADMILTR